MSIGVTSCEPAEGSKSTVGLPPSVDDIHITVVSTKENPNVVRFTFDSEKMIPIWTVTKKDGTEFICSDYEFTLDYPLAGEYSGTIQAYGKGGLSDVKSFTFKVLNDDPDITQIDPVFVEYLTASTWIWDVEADYHMGCGGFDTDYPSWWSPKYNEQEWAANYDDELIFTVDGKILLDTKGKIFVNETAVQTMDPVNFPNGSQYSENVDYVQTKVWAWELNKNDKGELYLSFSQGAFPSYVASPSALGDSYEVLLLTENTLLLRWKDSDRYWYYKFRHKK